MQNSSPPHTLPEKITRPGIAKRLSAPGIALASPSIMLVFTAKLPGYSPFTTGKPRTPETWLVVSLACCCCQYQRPTKGQLNLPGMPNASKSLSKDTLQQISGMSILPGVILYRGRKLTCRTGICPYGVERL
ncbi:hypothetical protein PoB_003780700 [Plakobranchus ocellatus]|uniref:Uncharacterized protein n=1 Tax=Plakobranchus ocellatus TaxID=259542 RepID=A0AAV4AVI0_9GAST|nr:hypothetical protein PoB_003780700 [Plakobranchus ocellatus]